MKLFFTFVLFFFFFQNFFPQEDVQLGSSLNQFRQAQGGFYDYSDPEALNIKVSVWGFVKFPGRYVIPIYSNVNDLLSFSGGPTDDADLEDLRLYRVGEDSSQQLLKFNYNDLLWNEELKQVSRTPAIQAGDILLVPGEPRLYFRDYLSLTLSIVSTLISLSILILNIAK